MIICSRRWRRYRFFFPAVRPRERIRDLAPPRFAPPDALAAPALLPDALPRGFFPRDALPRDGFAPLLALPLRPDFVDRARRELAFPPLLLPMFLPAERRDVLPFLLDSADFLRRAAGRDRCALERGRLGKPIACLAVSAIGWPVAADLPAIAPITPPTTAPTGPATLPRTAPAAAPAAGFGMGGTVMFSLGFDS